jgi:chemotaxis protein MotB
MGQGASMFEGGADTGVLPDGGNSVLDIGTNTGQSGNNSGSNSGDKASAVTATPVPTSESQENNNTKTTGELSGNLNTEKEMKNLQAYVNNVLEDLNMGASVDTSIEERGLTITFKNDVFFDSGSDSLKTDMKGSLDKIATLLNRVDNPIVIEGYTDNVPINANNIYASNWQLSAARAANVAQYLVEKEAISGERLSAVGFGEYRPVASNDTAQGRSKNRRVEIVILYNAQ